MVINENNSQINSFGKGMNSDVSYDQVDNQSYVYGRNVRITKNTLIGKRDSSTDSYFYSQEGAISPVYSGRNIGSIKMDGSYETLAVKSIDDIAVIIARQSNKLVVFRFKIIDDNIVYESETLTPWWSADISDKQKDFEEVKQVSAVLYQELEGVIKLYIATGVYPIIELRVDGDKGYGENQQIDFFINNRILPEYPVYIDAIVDGALKTSQVQYTYRYYNKFESTTQLAPLTNKIQVIDSNRSKETGNAQDTTTSIGFTLKIRSRQKYEFYKRLQIFRLSYINPGEDAKVELIYDGETPTTTNEFVFNDVGTTPLSEYTMEEFAAMSGLVVIPRVIEQNQQYMFASNIKDDTIIQDVVAKNGDIKLTKGFDITLSTNLNKAPEHSKEKLNYGVYSKYLKDRNVNPDLVESSYNNIFTSSLFRSLRRGETYRYGIVYYDKYGRRTNVLPITDNKGQKDVDDTNYTKIDGTELKTTPIGVEITIPQPYDKDGLVKDIIGCQIVRRSARPVYQKTLLQVALTRPVQQDLYPIEVDSQYDTTGSKKSPMYPSGYLFSGAIWFNSNYYTAEINADWQRKPATQCMTPSSLKIFQIFSNEIDFARKDVLSKLNQNSIILKINRLYGLIGNTIDYYNEQARKYTTWKRNPVDLIDVPFDLSANNVKINNGLLQNPSNKSTEYMLFPLYLMSSINSQQFDIDSVKDVKLPEWSDGFTNLRLDGSKIAAGGIKKYQQFTTNIGGETYNNWASSAGYDLKISVEDEQPNVHHDVSQFLSVENNNNWGNAVAGLQTGNFNNDGAKNHYNDLGYIGPGPSCFLINTKNTISSASGAEFRTLVCNIQHNTSTVESEPDEYVQYFGFGNYFNLILKDNKYQVQHYEDNVTDATAVVFDGDVYVTPHEITTMYKAYDFESLDTLPSMQVVNYIPLESKVNTFFDYGMNFLNTSSANLLLEPGSIDGVTTQDRPVHQYNQIYSANDESNDVFTLVVEKSQDNNFKQRTYYSDPKTNGEYIDNFVVFKPASFIDVDGKYGEVTNLLTDTNNLYYWQNHAFGKFSVNERSLVNDQNGNTIMLGQAGILSRYDYISTRYGMRPYDFCAIGAEGGIYWIDVNNSAVVASKQGSCGNLGEQLNVQNIINQNISTAIPKINYDLQNNELLCSCLVSSVSSKTNLDQFVFNLKLGVATSVYTRDYSHILNMKNTLYGIKFFDQINQFSLTKYNNLNINDVNTSDRYLRPMYFSIVTNASASTTKVFDSQQIIPVQRDPYVESDELASLLENRGFGCRFHTDLNEAILKRFHNYANTDREGNIIYNVPRYGNEDYGNRLRGKWMKTDFSVTVPDETVSISHIITKFRQSYS